MKHDVDTTAEVDFQPQELVPQEAENIDSDDENFLA